MSVTRPDWALPPAAFFFCPGRDTGLATLAPLPPMWRTIPKARLAAGSVSESPEIATRIRDHIDTHFRRRAFRAGLALSTVPVVLDDVAADDHFLSVGGKWLLTGAAGTRLHNRYVWKNEGLREAEDDIAELFAHLRAEDPPAPPIDSGGTGGLPFVIDARNGTNFYHFISETLGHLSLVDHDGFSGTVHIHLKGDEVRPFMAAWVEALYPRLTGRVRFETGGARYPRAISVLNARHYYYQTGDRIIPSLDHLAPESHFWKGRTPDRTSVAILAMNACDESLIRLRETAHTRIAGKDWSHLPRRFWVGRRSARDRAMAGEAELSAALAERGFATVYFEDMTPLEQVAIMARAQVMLGYHGAGFANMIFADADTHCIELGTLQTCLFRWQDFMPHALASGCRYTSLFADYNVDDPDEDMDERRGKALAPVALRAQGRARVLEFVDALLGRVQVAPRDRLFELAEMLSRLEDHVALTRLLDAHPGAESGNADLLILRANALQGSGNPHDAFERLNRAWDLTGDRPFLLERAILLGRELGRDTSALETAHGRAFAGRAAILKRKLRRRSTT